MTEDEAGEALGAFLINCALDAFRTRYGEAALVIAAETCPTALKAQLTEMAEEIGHRWVAMKEARNG